MRRLKTEYLEKLNEALKNKLSESVTVDFLVTKQKGRPLLFGKELDADISCAQIACPGILRAC